MEIIGAPGVGVPDHHGRVGLDQAGRFDRPIALPAASPPYDVLLAEGGPRVQCVDGNLVVQGTAPHVGSAALDGIRQAGVAVEVASCDLTDSIATAFWGTPVRCRGRC
ncbi:hypothetical protein [Couchioplanes caeruleus]|uniref:Uncharacterized protein n=2 Tax=Couchioplanes caeruleus TaxID=56438 RepID=A0A1K0FXE8_9ACTN|nr:hypothetical protein [Couchioplanes caeruleus]OJF09754.1 hypothetical protein BG844_35795 [Couchioplanes caeruleus subsp. caeruleus]ROP28352.1 hypothetical protein EDD30_1101 [Couchioplanes caeruleus]